MIGLLERVTRGGRAPDLRTKRLVLVAITPEMLRAEATAPERLAKLLRARRTQEWPPEHWEPHVLGFIGKQYEDEPRTMGWHRYVLLLEGNERTLVGVVGAFPKLEGDVEIGYSTLPEFQRRGIATEAVTIMVDWLLRQRAVVSVSAQTFPRLPESIKVMESCGMTFAGDGDEPGTIRYRRMR